MKPVKGLALATQINNPVRVAHIQMVRGKSTLKENLPTYSKLSSPSSRRNINF
jgi:hypothetical protein